MLFQFGFYSSLLLITFSQGLVYCILLLRKAIAFEIKSNYWLSFFLFLCCLYIAPWMLGFAGWYDNQPYRDLLFYIPFQNLFLFGPVIYFYTQSLLNSDFKVNKKTLLHFLPGLLYLLYSISIWVYDYFIYKGYFFYKDGIDKDFESWYQYSGSVSMIIYLLASIRYYNLYKKMVYQFTSFAESIIFKWIKTYLIAFLVLILLPILFDLVGLFYPDAVTYKGSWYYFLAYSIVMYYLAITAYSNPLVTKFKFRTSTENSKPILLIKAGEQEEDVIDIEAYEIDTTASIEVEKWKGKIENLIHSEELYKNPELTLRDISIKLDATTNTISKAINLGFNMNFNDLINSYRIEALIESIRNGNHAKNTLLALAFDSGFNSKATFNRAFKKSTGMTPKDFISANNLQIN